MALNRSALALSQSLGLVSPKALRRRKNNNPTTQYSVLEPRQLLATIAWSGGDITQDNDVSVNGTLVFSINASDPLGNPTTRVNGVNFVGSTRADAGSISQA